MKTFFYTFFGFGYLSYTIAEKWKVDSKIKYVYFQKKKYQGGSDYSEHNVLIVMSKCVINISQPAVEQLQATSKNWLASAFQKTQ